MPSRLPQHQGDPTRVAQLIARLQSQHIEVHRSNAAFTVKEGAFGVGTYLVRLDQPYRNYAVDLLAPQEFPKDGGEPYDDVSWQLPAHYHVEAVAIADPAIKNVGAIALTEAPQPSGKIAGDGPTFVLRDTGQEGLLEARYRLAQFKIEIAERAFKVGDQEYPAGSWILPAQSGLRAALQDLTRAARARVRCDRLDSRCRASRCQSAATRRVGAVGRHGQHRLAAPHARRAQRSVFIRARRRHSRRQSAREVRRAALRPRRSRAGGADPRPAENVGTDAVQEDPADAESRHARSVRRHHRRHRLGRTRADSEVRRERRRARHARQRDDARARRRHRAWRATRLRRHAAQRRQRRRRIRTSRGAIRHSHTRSRMCAFRSRSPIIRSRMAIPRTRMCSDRTIRSTPSRAAGCAWRSARPASTARPIQAASSCSGATTGTDQPFLVSGQVWGESNLIGRPAILDMPVGRGRVVAFNFNPAASRPEPRRPAPAVERHPELGSDPRAALTHDCYDSAMNEQKPRRGQWISGLLFVLLAAIAIGAILLQLSASWR